MRVLRGVGLRAMLGGRMESEIRSQPSLLAARAERYLAAMAPIAARAPFEMALIAARGSSDNAALYARYLIEIHLGLPVELAAPSVLTRYGARVRYPRCLAIGISQSGEATDVSEVLAALRAQGHATLAITNTSGSPLASCADVALELGLGPELSVPATKTYTASLLALYQLVRSLGGAIPDPAPLLPDDGWVETCRADAERAVGLLLRSQLSFALARGYRFCSAFETALKLMECALLPCKPYSSADFEHGPKALAGHGTAAIVYGEGLPALAAQGCLVIEAPSPPPEVPELLQPLWDIFFGQWLALLAGRSRALDPDDPRYLTKVTRTL